MIKVQIVERSGADLFKTLIKAMRSGELRTFKATNRGKKVTHINESYPGWIKWSQADGVINSEIRSPRKPGTEWRLLTALIGRLADKYADHVDYISIQFPDAHATKPKARRRRRPRKKR